MTSNVRAHRWTCPRCGKDMTRNNQYDHRRIHEREDALRETG